MRRRFAVDEWRCESNVYFLTHLHADHTEGLSADWCRGPIYCSQVTAMLLLAKFKGFNSALVHVLELGTPTLVSHNSSDLEVTAIDADHCPGAVSFVLHGDFGCVVHTGDFRWNNDRLSLDERKSQLTEALGGIQVDVLYVDNTFCNPMFVFPSRNEAANRVIELIRSYPDHDVVIGIDNLGKEELLLCIAEELKTKICVWPERLRTIHMLQLPDVFTTDTTVTRIRAIPRYTVSTDCLKRLNELRPTVGILPTGSLCLCNPMKLKASRCSNSCFKVTLKQASSGGVLSSLIHVVPYSLHCCFPELREFYDLVSPKEVVGIVRSLREYSIIPGHHLHPSTASTTSIEQETTRSSVQLVTRFEVDFEKKKEQIECKRWRRYKFPRKRQRLQGRGVKIFAE